MFLWGCYHHVLGPRRQSSAARRPSLATAPMSVSSSTRILSGKPPRAMWSAAMLLGLYRMSAPSYQQLNAGNSLQHLHLVGERLAKRLRRIPIKLYDIAQPDYARTAWPTRCQLFTKKAASALHPLLRRLSALPLINPGRGNASGTSDARIHRDLGFIPRRSTGRPVNASRRDPLACRKPASIRTCDEHPGRWRRSLLT